MKRAHLSVFSLVLVSGLGLATAPTAFAQHSPGPNGQPGHKDGGHGHGAAAKAPETYAAAIKEIRERLAEVGAAVAKGDMAMAHEEADAAGSIARNLGALALKPGSGVDKARVRAINLAGKALAEAGDRLHDAGEKKDAAGVTAAYKEMQKQFDSLDAAAPAVYFCPMHCEGAKTYDKPGNCPVCSMNLKKQTTDKYSVAVKATAGGANSKVEAGKPASLTFTIKDPTGLAVTKVETVHEKLLHLLIVSKDLSWFRHEHPAVQKDGTFTLSFTFPQGGEYILYHDFTPPGVGQQVVQVPLTVEGTAPAPVKLTVDDKAPKTIDGYTVALDTGGEVKSGGSTHMAFTISKDGKPVTTLAPYLGAMGHLVIISEDRTEFVHSHPHEAGAEHAAAATGPKVEFEAMFMKPGIYKGWGQFNVGTKENEKIITAPFTFSVSKGDGKDGHGEKGKDEHKHGAAPANTVCPITADAADAKITRDFKGQAVAFHDAASAAAWDKLSDTNKMSKFVAAIAASSAKGGHDGDDAMPVGVGADEERALYLTPGGIYTEADIKANGSMTAGDKYKGKMAKHDMKPKAGDKVCPITMTKANPKFTWIIGGKTYEFCCPPCIDEYVLLAKTSPKEVLDPSEYVKK